MMKKSAWLIAAIIGLAVNVSAICGQERSGSDGLKIENELYVVEVNKTNGAVTRIKDKVGGMELISEARLADNYKFALILPGKEEWETIEANFILGKEQRVTSVEQSEQCLELVWGGPLKNYLGESYDVSVTMKIELAGGQVRFEMKIDNRTGYEIGEVYYPMLGGIKGLGQSREQQKGTLFVRPDKEGVKTSDIFRVFDNFSWLGGQGAEQFYLYPDKLAESWGEFYAADANRSMYFGAHDVAGRKKVLYLELVPFNTGTVREDGNWPRSEETGDVPVGMTACYVQFANHRAHDIFEGTPVVLQFHDGNWKQGKQIYQRYIDGRK